MLGVIWVTPAVVATGLALAIAAPASASEDTSARTVEWSTDFETAAAAGQRWTEPGSSGLTRDLVLSGTLSSTGDNCCSLWTRFVSDLAPGPTRKQAQICGPGTVDVDARQAHQAVARTRSSREPIRTSMPSRIPRAPRPRISREKPSRSPTVSGSSHRLTTRSRLRGCTRTVATFMIRR